MARKNIFELVEDNYNVQDEIRIINKLFFDENYFGYGDYQDYTLEELLEEYLFTDWKYRGTCLTIKDFMRRANASIDYGLSEDIPEEVIINNIEVIENLLMLYFDNANNIFTYHSIEYFTDLNKVFCHLIDTLEKHMGLVKKKIKGKIILYPKDAPLEQVVKICDDEDVQWELIRYSRENLSLLEKKKALAYFATHFAIEKEKEDKGTPLYDLVDRATHILNNLQIRHNNKPENSVNSVIDEISKTDAIALCDYTFNLILSIILLREQKKYEATYKAFRDKQKEAAKNKNKEKK